MNLLVVLGIAVSLAMDAFSVCVAAGVKIQRITFRHYFRLAFHFGLFQFMMPLFGFYGGLMVENLISRFDHWIAFVLLAAIGLKMIVESFSPKDAAEELSDPSRGMTLVMLSIATSIDAAAVGFSFAALNLAIIYPAILIGLVCALFSVIGVYLGKRIGSLIGVWAERLGGAVLISIGLKILLEHLL